MPDITKCAQCDRDNKEDGVYTDDGRYLCARCCEMFIKLADKDIQDIWTQHLKKDIWED